MVQENIESADFLMLYFTVFYIESVHTRRVVKFELVLKSLR